MTVAYLLALASVVALVFFLAHLVGEIRVETMLDTVRTDAGAGSSRLGEPSSEPTEPIPRPPPEDSARGAGPHASADHS